MDCYYQRDISYLDGERGKQLKDMIQDYYCYCQRDISYLERWIIKKDYQKWIYKITIEIDG